MPLFNKPPYIGVFVLFKMLCRLATISLPMDVLFKLFGSSLRVKLLRLFFMAPEELVTLAHARMRTDSDAPAVRRELNLLAGIGFIKERSVSAKVKTGKARLVKAWRFDSTFMYADALKRLVLSAECMNPVDIVGRLKGKGAIRLIILAGIFIDDENSRADMVIVGDQLKKTAIEEAIREIESRVGKELSYSLLSTKEFKYRIDMRDKFIRDVLDYPHKKILNKLGV